MKKAFVVLPVLAFLVACGSAPKDTYEKRAAEAESKREAQVERALSKAPKWMAEVPISTSAVYANGTAVSSDMSMADYKAKLFAYGKICMAAGGQVSQQAKTFMLDTNSGSAENSELAIKSMCPGIDITGVETKEVKRIAEGSRYRTYVLVALPTGDANALQKRKDNLQAQDRANKRSGEAFKELDKITPSVQLYPDTTAQ
jgi:hypothetical protein